MSTATVGGFRVCIQCGNRFPESYFRWRKVGQSRRSECRFCHCENERRRSRLAREKQQVRRLARACRDIVAAEDVRNLHRRAGRLARRFGGSESLAEKLRQLVDALSPDSPTYCDIVLAVIKIQAMALAVAPPPEPEPMTVTLEQRRMWLQRELELLLIEQPAAHAEFLHSIGWQAVPPSFSAAADHSVN